MSDEMLNDFRDECYEHLQVFEDNLLIIQTDGFTNETINSIFRSVHTIKGISGMFNFNFIVEFTHVAENLLDKLRNGEVEIDSEKLASLLKAKDQITSLVNYAILNNGEEPEEDDPLLLKSSELITELAYHISGEEPEEEEDEEEEQIKLWKIILKPCTNETKFYGMEPSQFIGYLNEVGSIEEIHTNISNIPLLEDFDPEILYMDFEIILKTIIGKAEIEKIFNFISTLFDFEITPYDRRKSVRSDDVKQETIEEEVVTEEVTEEESKSGSVIEEKPFVEKRIISQPAEESKNTIKEATSKEIKEIQQKIVKSTTLRVDSARIDSLINLIGEMVIANANVVQKALSIKDKELIESTSVMTRMLEEIRENGMKMRMIPIGDTFNRFKRIVYDTSQKLDKKIELSIRGGETELDKTVIEKITDPLVHIIRNSVDHGIESPEIRRESGKPESGKVSISAFHEAGSIAIEITDDGKGLDKEIIFNKAVEKGLLVKDDELSEKEIYALIFKPGFSTAEKVSDLSGRGVGMEVVKKNIDALRGDIDIFSEVGKGTKITIRLPLTLAIIDGFMVQVGETYFIIPLDMLVECIELTEEYKDHMRGNNFINLRGKILPLLNTSEYFEENSKNTRDNIVIVRYAEEMMGLVVDELHGEFQTVIKPLGKIFENVTGLSGATILGNGDVALILDIPVLIQYAKNLKNKQMVNSEE